MYSQARDDLVGGPIELRGTPAFLAGAIGSADAQGPDLGVFQFTSHCTLYLYSTKTERYLSSM